MARTARLSGCSSRLVRDRVALQVLQDHWASRSFLGRFPLDIALDVEIGVGSSGRLRLWLNSDPDTTEPYLLLNALDNAVTGGADRVSFGLFSTTTAFASELANHAFTFGHITTSDDQLFRSNFESLLAGNIEPNQQPLPLNGASYGGNTCDGTDLLPQAASGTTVFAGPVAVHPVTLTGGLAKFFVSASAGSGALAMFLCPAGAGPSDACIGYGTSLGIVYLKRRCFGRVSARHREIQRTVRRLLRHGVRSARLNRVSPDQRIVMSGPPAQTAPARSIRAGVAPAANRFPRRRS